MNKEVISTYQGICVMTMFIFGSSVVLGGGTAAKQDIWIAIIIAILMSVPTLFVYSKLLVMFPSKGLFDILYIVFGKTLGKTFVLLYVWYTFHLGALVIRNFSEFVQIVGLPETPQFIFATFLILTCIWAVKEGVEVIGRWAAFVFPFILVTFIFLLSASLTKVHFINLMPVMSTGLGPILDTAFGLFAFPLAETVIITMFLGSLRKDASAMKVYFLSLLIGGIVILLVSTRNILILGIDIASNLYFPTYSAVRLIQIGDFFQRLEVFVAVIFTLVGIVKISVCLYAASSGLSKVVNIDDYRKLVVPVGLLMMQFSMIVYRNVMEMFEWAFKVYKYYAFPFQVIFPLIIFVFAYIKVNITSKNAPSNNNS